MNALQIFKSDKFGAIRVIVNEGELWFVAKDVCGCLGLGRQQDSTRYLDEDEKGECLVNTPSGEQTVVMVSEPGLYSLILRSRKSEAKAFKRWITHEVIPSIRKTGKFELTGEAPIISDLQKAIKELEQRIVALEPEAKIARFLGDIDEGITFAEFARVISSHGFKGGRNTLFGLLRKDGFLIKKNGSNMPTQKAINMKLFTLHEKVVELPSGVKFTILVPLITGKGQKYIIQKYALELA